MPDDSLELAKFVERGNKLHDEAWDCLIQQAEGLDGVKQKFAHLRAELKKFADDVKQRWGALTVLDKLIAEIESILSDIEKGKYAPKDAAK